MSNAIWSWAGLVTALVAGAGLGYGYANITALATSAGLDPGFLGAPLSNPLFLASLILSLGALLWLIIGWALPVLVLGVKAGKALTQDASDAGSLDDDGASAFINELQNGKTGGKPASGQDALDSVAGRWFYHKLPLAGLAITALVAFYAQAHSTAFAEPGVESGPTLAMACLFVGVLFSVIGFIFFWLADGFTRTRLDRILLQAPSLAASSELTRLGADMQEALLPTITALNAASEHLMRTHADSVQGLLTTALDKFIDQLGATTGARFSAISEALAALDKAASATLASVQKAQEQLGKTTEQQVKSLGEGYSGALHTMQKQQSKHTTKAIDEIKHLADSLQSMVQAAIASIGEHVAQSRSANDALLAALSRATSTAGASHALHDAVTAAPETVRRLSSAIRDLQKAASEPMPDL